MTIISRKGAVIGACIGTAVLGGGALTGVAMAASSTPTPTTSTSAGTSTTAKAGAAAARLGKVGPLAKHVLHGQFTVQTKKGVRVVDTEVGVITAVTPTSVSVKASDGYTQTWTLGATTHVRANRQKGSVSDLTVGETVRLLGPTSGGTASAVLAVVTPAA